MKPKLLHFLLVVFLFPLLVSCAPEVEGTLNKKASYELIERVVPDYADLFEVEYLPKEGEADIFELEQCGDKIVLRGNNGVSVASALNYYLKNYAHCEYSWNASNLKFPDPVPTVPEKVRKETPYQYRHYFNYCAFNYTSSWWDWDRCSYF